MKKQHVLREKILIIIFSMLIIIPVSGLAQNGFLVTQCETEEEVIALIDTVLLYNVDSAFKQNISFTGNPNSVGYFTNGGIFNFTETTGIALTTGYSGYLDHSNTCSAANASANMGGSSDPDLNTMTGMQTFDAVIIEFDINRLSNSVFLNYVFGSEEYHDYVNSQFNDAFGFFLSGPGIDGPYTNNAINIATVPGTDTPVSVNTINCGKQTLFCTAPPGNGPNCDLLVDNTDNTQGSFNQFVLDAFTKPLNAVGEIQGGEWYHIKLAIGDVGDAVFDSGILLEKGSIVANPFDFQVLTCESEEDVINIVDTVLLSNVYADNKKNISFKGDPQAVGYFYGGDFLGLHADQGIVLSNGLVNYIPDVNQCNTGANASANNGGLITEPDLKQLSGGG
ncbi:MAG: hypothetical protein GXO86_12685, partial [Chlorobi bacterium]|nr:hypothetical protein [Chlorobiota bacterium]